MQRYSTDKSGRLRSWEQCPCGWRGKKHLTGRRPTYVLFTPFCCPKCGTTLSSTTALYGNVRLVPVRSVRR